MSIDRESFRASMRRLAAAVCVVTTVSEEGGRFGLTATAVSAVCAEPPTLLACINSGTGTYAAIRAAGRFAVNVLPAESSDIAARFASPIAPEQRFTEGRWVSLATGCPVLESALAAFECTLAGVTEIGTHGIVLGGIEAVRLRPPHVKPLLYAHATYGAFAALEPARGAYRGQATAWLASDRRLADDAMHWGLL